MFPDIERLADRSLSELRSLRITQVKWHGCETLGFSLSLGCLAQQAKITSQKATNLINPIRSPTLSAKLTKLSGISFKSTFTLVRKDL